jgi:hypothetical protein
MASEYKLIFQRRDIEQNIADCEGKIKCYHRDILKCEKELALYKNNLEIVNDKINNSFQLYQRAFAYILKTVYNGNIDNFFKHYINQETLIEDFTAVKRDEALKIVLLYYTVKTQNWDDILMLYNLSFTCKSYYQSVIRLVHSAQPSIIHFYPSTQIYVHIMECYEKLSDENMYNPFSRNIMYTPIHYIKEFQKWNKILNVYWNINICTVIPPPDKIPDNVKTLLLNVDKKDEMTTQFRFEQLQLEANETNIIAAQRIEAQRMEEN